MDAMTVERWGWYSIGLNLLLAAVNLTIAVASGSRAVGAETVHNLVDLLIAVAVLIGLVLSPRKTRAFPYGLYKLENVITVALAGMIFLTAYEIARGAVTAPPDQTTTAPWMFIGVIAGAIMTVVFSHFQLQAGRLSNSPALIASAKEFRVHAFTSGAVLAALLAQWISLPLDRIAALVIVVVIGKTGWDLLVDGIRVLLDGSLDSDTLMQIWETISVEESVTEVLWVTGRNAGRYRFVEAGVALRLSSLKEAEAARQRIENRIRQTIPFVERVLIHIQEKEVSSLRCAVPLANRGGALSTHLGAAPYFALLSVDLGQGAIEEQQVLANPHQAEEQARGLRVAEWIVTLKVDVVFVRESLNGKGPAYVFGEAGVEIRTTEVTTLAEVMEELVARGQT
jgi:cation diffusion facilitator family transporter